MGRRRLAEPPKTVEFMESVPVPGKQVRSFH
jgi:hypothetical protein